MSIPTITEADLRRTIKALICADKEPLLSEDQIDVLVRQSFRRDANNNAPELAFERVGSKEYKTGTRMVPMNRNGHVYICITSGVTASSEPSFSGESEEVVTDGSCVWMETGTTAWEPTYNQFASISLGWELKAAECAGIYQFSSDGQSFNRQQVYEHCIEMAKQWRMKKTGAATIHSSIKNNSSVADAFVWQLPEQILEDRGIL